DISKDLTEEIQDLSQQVFTTSRCRGMVRIDFMYAHKKLYPIEINPIPGSMAYYLWEATGVAFTQQITDLLNEAISHNKKTSGYVLTYSSDIIDKFVSSTNQ